MHTPSTGPSRSSIGSAPTHLKLSESMYLLGCNGAMVGCKRVVFRTPLDTQCADWAVMGLRWAVLSWQGIKHLGSDVMCSVSTAARPRQDHGTLSTFPGDAPNVGGTYMQISSFLSNIAVVFNLPTSTTKHKECSVTQRPPKAGPLSGDKPTRLREKPSRPPPRQISTNSIILRGECNPPSNVMLLRPL